MLYLRRGLLPEKLGGGVRPTSQNPYPIYDQTLRFLLPYLWPGARFSKVPKSFRTRKEKSRSKISNLMTTELF